MTTKRFLPEGAKARFGKGMPSNVAYSPDGTQLAVASSMGTWLYDAYSGEVLNLLARHTGTNPDADRLTVYSVAYSPDGSMLASGNRDGTVLLWNAETGERKRTLTGHTDIVHSVAYSPDGSTLVSGSKDNTVCLWDTATGALRKTFIGHASTVLSVTYSPDGDTITSGSEDGTVLLWDIS